MSKRSFLNKQILLNRFGGCCKICGYNRCNAALEFHHITNDKKFNISKFSGKSLITFEMAQELTKVILICANCHREVHAGLHSKFISEVELLDIQNFI